MARAAAEVFGWELSDRDLADMVTRDAARAVGWDKALGTVEAGRRADLVVLHGRPPGPYRRLVSATERGVIRVIVNGVSRYGQPRLVADASEHLAVGGSARDLYPEQETVDPIVAAISYGEAVERLHDGLGRLAELARELEAAAGPVATALGAPGHPARHRPGIPRGEERWVPELADEEPGDTSIRPPAGTGATRSGRPTGRRRLSEILGPLELDPLTVLDDPTYRRLRTQPNLPPAVADRL